MHLRPAAIAVLMVFSTEASSQSLLFNANNPRERQIENSGTGVGLGRASTVASPTTALPRTTLGKTVGTMVGTTVGTFAESSYLAAPGSTGQ